ncbi:MAG: hypothetical protein JJU22_11865 [Gammaproteobacteria bacterium]|nr:hypothetical protein [Gammaproteobacteria bacterium]
MPATVFFATLDMETHSFSSLPAGWSVWRDTLLQRRSDGRPTGDPREIPYAKAAPDALWPLNPHARLGGWLV